MFYIKQFFGLNRPNGNNKLIFQMLNIQNPNGTYFSEGESLDGKKETTYNPWPSFTFTGKLRPFPQSETRSVPPHIGRPDYADHPKGHPLSEQAVKGSSQIKVLNDEEIEGNYFCTFLEKSIFNTMIVTGMKVSCKLGREVLDEAARVCDVGVTTDEIDRIVHEACIERECYPSPLNYYEFPKSCCTSVNEV